MRKLLPLLATLAAVAIACDGNGVPDPTARDISDAELAAMVLPLEELGSAYADFERDDDSGFQSNEDKIDDAFDEEDEEGDVERYGRVTGYEESYTSVEGLLEEGVFIIGTMVALYEDSDGASGDLKDEVNDSKDAEGTTDEGVTVGDVEEFDPDDFGDESVGLVLALSGEALGDLTFYGTLVAFRRGRIIGSVVIARFDDEDVRDEATELARKLDERVQAVLRGEVEARTALDGAAVSVRLPLSWRQPSLYATMPGRRPGTAGSPLRRSAAATP